MFSIDHVYLVSFPDYFSNMRSPTFPSLVPRPSYCPVGRWEGLGYGVLFFPPCAKKQSWHETNVQSCFMVTFIRRWSENFLPLAQGEKINIQNCTKAVWMLVCDIHCVRPSLSLRGLPWIVVSCTILSLGFPLPLPTPSPDFTHVIVN